MQVEGLSLKVLQFVWQHLYSGLWKIQLEVGSNYVQASLFLSWEVKDGGIHWISW